MTPAEIRSMATERLARDWSSDERWAGIERLRLGLVDGLDSAPRPRWPLDAAAPQRRGGRG